MFRMLLTLRTPFMLRLLSCVCLLGVSNVLCAQQSPRISARMSAGGTGRYMAERWGMVKAIVHNPTNTPQDALFVVTPPDSGGVQFARSIRMPANCATETSWPIFVNEGLSGNVDFEYLTFPGGTDTNIIKRREHQEVLSTYSALVRPRGPGLTAWLAAADVSDEENRKVQRLMRAMRFAVYRDVGIVSMVPREITSHAETLDAIDQVVVSNDRLGEHPECCESIRLWLQRGGRLLICLDQTGPEALEYLLGDAFPFAVVGETSANSVKLELNPTYRTDSYPIREVLREFDEPVRYIRIIADHAEPIWTVDGWPVALQIPYGLGQVVVTTISPDVFYQQKENRADSDSEFEPIPSMRRIQDTLFVITPPHILNQEAVSVQAAGRIGYAIPSRTFAMLLTLGFPLLLLCGGLILLQSHKGERLLWLVPLLAVFVSIPAVSKGMATKDVAPATAIQTHILNAVPGQTQLVSDGLATVYSPDPATMLVHGDDGSILEPPVDASNRDYRRLVWTGKRQNEWFQLNQPKGVSSLQVRSLRTLSRPLDAVATFTSDGLQGQLQMAELSNARNAVFASSTPDIMAVRIDPEGSFTISPAAILAPGEFFEDTLVSDEQRQHAAIYASMFDSSQRADAFPRQPSLMYWVDAGESALQIGDDGTSREEQLLVIQPLRLEPPALNQTIRIPSAFVPFRVVVDDGGSFSSVYNSSKRIWDASGREGAGSVRLQFELPETCLPFETQATTATLRIRAGSRNVKVTVGSPGEFHHAKELTSPVGSFEFELPLDAVRDTMKIGKLWVQIDVSDLNQPEPDEPAVGEQDDSWVIEQLSLTVQGQRVDIKD